MSPAMWHIFEIRFGFLGKPTVFKSLKKSDSNKVKVQNPILFKSVPMTQQKIKMENFQGLLLLTNVAKVPVQDICENPVYQLASNNKQIV